MINNQRYDPHLFDEFEMRTEYPDEFRMELKDQEDNSEWIPGIPTNEMALESVIGFEAQMAEDKYGFSPDICLETASESGSQLILAAYNRGELVRKCARDSIERAAGITGPALSRMKIGVYADTVNNCLNAVPDNRTSLLLKRYEKLSSVHGDGKNGYEIMPPTRLYDDTVEALGKRFGTPRFTGGTVSHTDVSCSWILPQAKAELIQKYKDALNRANAVSCYPINFVPGAIFRTSDTSESSAMLIPGFYFTKKRFLRFADGVSVRHSKNPDRSGCDAYREALGDIFAKFEDAAANIARLAGITVYHPENCIIRLCAKYKISPRYGDGARAEICRLTRGESCTAHDIYLAMSECLAEADYQNAGKSITEKLEESVASIAKIVDWTEFDVGGTVAWKN